VSRLDSTDAVPNGKPVRGTAAGLHGMMPFATAPYPTRTGSLPGGSSKAQSYLLARPIPGIGIAVPTFVPPVAAAGAALLLSREGAPAVAFVAVTLGTLIGADLMNLGRVQGLGAPIVSIGGAGTFDGIFLTGILAALLA
jgi:hypothetical protein